MPGQRGAIPFQRACMHRIRGSALLRRAEDKPSAEKGAQEDDPMKRSTNGG